MDLKNWQIQVEEARGRIRDHVRKTPLEQSLVLVDRAGAKDVHIKLESEQVTGSFKVRGAFNKILKMAAPDSGVDLREKHPLCASTGNHGMACNYALKKLGLSGTTFVPTTISAVKEAALQRMGAEVIKSGTDCMDGELAARKLSETEGRPYISPYNDIDVVIGQGTIGMEIYEELPDVDVVLVPVGGGGLIGGIAAYLKAVKPQIQVVGCTPALSKVMYESVRAGHIVFEDSGDTLSDGTAGGIEDGAVTFELCQKYVDEWILVTEDEIADALYFMIQHHHKIVEGAAGCSIGGFLKHAERFRDKNVVIVSCGANISIEKVKTVLDRGGRT